MGPLALHAEIEHWPLAAPFRISGHTWHAIEVLVVSLAKDGHVGRGEARGVYYRNDTPSTMLEQVESVRSIVESGVSRAALQTLLPAGGARNAVDCALWELEAKLEGCPAWQIAGLNEPRPLLTTFTCGADGPANMAATARGYVGARAIKLKLIGDSADADRVRAVREALSDVWLGIDANQGFTRAAFDLLMPVLVDARVALIEQPFPVGQEVPLEELQSPIPIAADESVQTVADIARLARCCNVVNIKLDKCGGLTEGLVMAQAAHRLGLDTMVGNMIGTSLAMAPAFILGQLCKVVDLDGVVFLKTDRARSVRYEDGLIVSPPALWG